MRPLQLHLLYHYRPRKDVITKLVPVNVMIQSHLKWWILRQNLLYGMPFPQPSPSVTLTTDASESGWGAHLDDISLAGTLWEPSEANPTHQPPGASGCSQGPSVLKQKSCVLPYSGQIRQLDSSVVPEPSRGALTLLPCA